MYAKAFIFDLDGVLTDTAKYHYLAWKQLSDKLGYYFDKEINERLKGVSRIKSFQIILEVNNALNKYTKEEQEKIINEKNHIYVELIKNITNKDILPGIEDLLDKCKENDIKCAVASASKNSFFVLENLGIKDKFDYIADANLIKNAKPNPEVFIDCIKAFNLTPNDCIGFEDAEAGIEAIQLAKMMSVGINVNCKTFKPTMEFKCTSQIDFDKIIEVHNKFIRDKI